jgi:hypothetical protein
MVAVHPPDPVPLATVKAYRRTGGAIVTVKHHGRTRRYRVSLRRYHALREWTLTRAAHRWRTSGAWLRASVACSIWAAIPAAE